MSGFSADWLALREPWDHHARSQAASALDLPGLAQRQRTRAGDDALAVLDLGCGTGSSLRALAPVLGAGQRWVLVDHDPALLAALPQRLQAWAQTQGHACQMQPDQARGQLAGRAPDGTPWSAELRWQAADLRELAPLPWPVHGLVTASALLDLVGGPWLTQLAQALAQHGSALMASLNVDGRHDWTPADADDTWVAACFAAHQRRDKGLGPALGGLATRAAQALWTARGWTVRTVHSDWVIPGDVPDPAGASMLPALIDGMAQAASEQVGAHASDELARIRGWRKRRHAQVAHTTLRVGHQELVVEPPG